MIEMKDSGIEWIGVIPAHWEVKRLKDVCEVVCGATPKDNESFWDGNIIWISPADMPDFGEIQKGARTITEQGYKSCGTTLVPAGSIILSTRAPIGKTNIAGRELCTNQGCKCLISRKLVMRFMMYCLRSKNEQLQALGRGTTFIELSTKDLSVFQVAIPPLAEQQAIADYLDKKTAEIDEQITALEKKSDAYQRLKRSLISEVVTRGLNPTAELKDSGIEWIGEIPAHWVVKRLKDIADLGSGTTPKSSNEKYYDGTHPWLITGDVQNRLIERNENFITDLALADIPNLKLYPAKTVLLAMYGGGTIGNVGLMTYPAYINQACCAMIPKSGIYEKYLFYYLRTKYSRIISTGVGGTQINLSQNKIAAYPIAVPPFKEQQAIADYLDKKTAEIDGNISAISSKIDAYKRLKQSLIDEVVTGKRRIERA